MDAKSFIKPENLDEAIEQALNSRVNYNFAIDLSGNRHIELSDGTCELEDPSESTSHQFSKEKGENVSV